MLMLKVWGIGIALMILCEWIENPEVIVPSLIFFVGLPIAIYLIYKVCKQLDSSSKPVLPKEEAAMPDEEDLSDMLGAESARFYGRESQEIDYYARSTQFRPSYNDVKQELKKTTSAGKQSGYHTENRNGLAHDSMPKESQQNASVLNGEIITDMFSYQMCQVDGWGGIEITSYNGFDEKRITIPEKLEQYEVIKIGSYAFRNTELEEIVCPDTILEIGDEAFSGCKNLIQINIPDSVRRIGMWAFSYCESLSVVVLPNSLTKLELGAFSSSGIEQIVFPSSLRSIPCACCSNCLKLKQVVISDGVKTIASEAFSRDELNKGQPNLLASIEIPASVECIRAKAFVYRKETALVFHGMNTRVDIQYSTDQIATHSTVFYVLPGSVMQKYARSNRFPIKPVSEFNTGSISANSQPDSHISQEKPSYSAATIRYDDEPVWRDIVEDGSEYGIYPEDYETETEYTDALEAEKYGWRDWCEDNDSGVNPNDYETEQEYDEAVQKAQDALEDSWWYQDTE